MRSTTASLATLVLGASAASTGSIEKRATTPVTVKGNAFFQGNTRFYMRGVDYQPGGSSNVADPIADTAGCKRDIANFQQLGINTIRVYTVDNTQNHDECMKALADAGIYLVLDLNSPKFSLNRADPHPSYNEVYLQALFATVDSFHSYDNTLAFFSGNEVVNDGPTSNTAPYVKAVTRDIRQYIANRGYRKIPVGYSAADVDTNRLQMAQYMNCGPDDERSDFFAFNDYSWCDPSSFTTSGWDKKVQLFAGYGIPIFLSEYGCNTNTRQWNEVKSLYSTDMTAVYSGGLVYEYSQEPSDYGLVEVGGSSVSALPDFQTLATAFKNTPNPQGDGGYNATGGASACPTQTSADWDVSNDELPAMPEGAKKFMTEGAGVGKGLDLTGAGSQNAGSASTGTASAGSGQPTRTGSASSSSTSKGDASARLTEGSKYAPAIAGILTIATLFGALL